MKKSKIEIFLLVGLILISVLVRSLFAIRYPIKIECYSDELRYYRIATSIANGTGISIYNMPSSFQKILYPLFIAPSCLLSSLQDRMVGIFITNCILMSLGVIAVYYLASKILKSQLLKWICCISYLVSRNMVYSMTIMSENLWFPLMLLLMSLFYYLIENENGDKKQIYINVIAGAVTYFCYLTKEIAIVIPVAYALYYATIIIYKKAINEKYPKEHIKVLIIRYISYLGAFLFIYIGFKLTFFKGMGNSYSQQGIEALLGPDKKQYLAYGTIYYLMSFSVMLFMAPILMPLIHFDDMDNKVKKLFLFLCIIAIGMAIIVSYTITIREDYMPIEVRYSPRAHMRYIAPIAIIFVIIFFHLLERNIKQEKKQRIRNLVITIIATIGFACLYHGFKQMAYLDNWMRLYSRWSDYGNGIFLLTLMISIGTIIIEILYGNYNKKAIVIFLICTACWEVVDNYLGIKICNEVYGLSIESANNMQELKKFVDEHGRNKFLIIDTFNTEEQKAIDTYLTQKNINITSINKLLTCGDINSLPLSDINVPVIWSTVNDNKYEKVHYDYIILRKGAYIKEDECCHVIGELSHGDYWVFDIRKENNPICISNP